VFVGTGEGAVVVYRVVVSQARDGSDEAPIARMDRRVPLRRGKRPVEQLAVLAHLHHVLALQGTLVLHPTTSHCHPPPPPPPPPPPAATRSSSPMLATLPSTPRAWWLADGGRLAVMRADGQVEVLELDTLERASTLPGLKGASLFAVERDPHLT
jgi:hypothetical protein